MTLLLKNKQVKLKGYLLNDKQVYNLWKQYDNHKTISHELCKQTGRKTHYNRTSLYYAIARHIVHNYKELQEELIEILERKHEKKYDEHMYQLFVVSLAFFLWKSPTRIKALFWWLSDHPELLLAEYYEDYMRYIAYYDRINDASTDFRIGYVAWILQKQMSDLQKTN